MGKPAAYRPVFSEGATDFLVALPKPRQRQMARLAKQLAADPFILCDYVEKDESGREISHLLIDDFVLAYWVDHAVAEVRIVEVDDVS